MALDAAMLSLRTCDNALAAATNLLLQPFVPLLFARAGMLSADGRCKTFDARANGYVRGEGVAAAALCAENAGLTLGGCAVRADGKSASLTAPNGTAQARMIGAALAVTNGIVPLDAIELALSTPLRVDVSPLVPGMGLLLDKIEKSLVSRIHGASEHGILPQENSQLVSQIVKLVRLIYSATPHSQHVHIGVASATQEIHEQFRGDVSGASARRNPV